MKKKKHGKSMAFGLMWIVAAGALIILILVRHEKIKKLEKKIGEVFQYAGSRAQLITRQEEYMQASTNSDTWWIREATEPDGELADSLERALSNVQAAVAASAGASPLAKEISSTFNSFFVTRFADGGAIAVKLGKFSREDLGTFEICFVPEAEHRKRRFPTTLFYRPDWNAVMMAAIPWPETFFKAVIMHELGHAYLNRKNGPKKIFTQAWFEEEVAMHELEAAVLDQNTGNRYTQKIREICEKHPSAQTVSEFAVSVPLAELLELDEIIGVRNRGHDIRGVTCAQHMIMLGFIYIDKKNGPVQDKVKHYRWYINK